jgi:hypothetical protein
LTGDILDLIDATEVSHVKAVLIPAAGPFTSQGTIRLGGIDITLDDNLEFSIDDLPTGDYQLTITYFDTEERNSGAWQSPTLEIAADGDIGALV